MAKITLKLDTRRAKRDGTYPLKVAIYRGGKTVYMPIDLSLKKEEWNRDKQEVVKRSDRRELNILLQDKLASLNAEVLKIQLNGELKGMTNKQLIAKLSGNDKQEPVNILNFYEAFVQNISNERTRDIYEVTLRKVRSFAGNRLTFEDITPSWLRAFEAFLAQTAPRVNARAIHLRNLRAVLNAAIDEEITSNYPFRRFKIKTQQTAKRALTAEQLLQLRGAKVESYQQKYIDLFFLGFYLIGINMVDLSRLRPFDGDRIVYERAKTHKLYSIKVEPEAREIIERYRGTELLLSLFEGIKSYRSFANRMN
ncbi:MAG: site-specific integrase, partial [Muribaculaceae bacterium]|nr:site-specific integrase [Muribaculaceae bacterium]